MTSIEILKPDDFHIHLREGSVLSRVLPASSARVFYGLVMPNLSKPLLTSDMVESYRQEIEDSLLPCHDFRPIFTLYLSDETDMADLRFCFTSGLIEAAKLYPRHGTTSSSLAPSSLAQIMKCAQAIAEVDGIMSIHGEYVFSDCDIFDREAVFIDKVLQPLVLAFPDLRVVFEHISCKESVDFVLSNSNCGATITPQHLLYDRNILLSGNLRPDFYCMPILKRKEDMAAIRAIALSGMERFFYGSDSAPHFSRMKYSSCGCAGVYSAPSGIESVAQVFLERNLVSELEKFISINGAHFYRKSIAKPKVLLQKRSWQVDEKTQIGDDYVTNFHGGMELKWQFSHLIK